MFVAVGVGLALCAVGIVSLIVKFRFLTCAVATDAVVSRAESTHVGVHMGPLAPTQVSDETCSLRFQTANGVVEIEKIPVVDSSKYASGDTVRIYYNPRDPKQVVLRSFEYWYFPSVVFTLGLACIALSLFFR